MTMIGSLRTTTTTTMTTRPLPGDGAGGRDLL